MRLKCCRAPAARRGPTRHRRPARQGAARARLCGRRRARRRRGARSGGAERLRSHRARHPAAARQRARRLPDAPRPERPHADPDADRARRRRRPCRRPRRRCRRLSDQAVCLRRAPGARPRPAPPPAAPAAAHHRRGRPANRHGDAPRHARRPLDRSDGEGVLAARIPREPPGRGRDPRRHCRARVGRAIRPVLQPDRGLRAASPPQAQRSERRAS